MTIPPCLIRQRSLCVSFHPCQKFLDETLVVGAKTYNSPVMHNSPFLCKCYETLLLQLNGYSLACATMKVCMYMYYEDLVCSGAVVGLQTTLGPGIVTCSTHYFLTTVELDLCSLLHVYCFTPQILPLNGTVC